MCSGRSLLPAADEQQEQEQRHDAECEGYQRTFCEARHEECEERHTDQGTLTHSGVSYGIIQRINEKVGQRTVP